MCLSYPTLPSAASNKQEARVQAWQVTVITWLGKKNRIFVFMPFVKGFVFQIFVSPELSSVRDYVITHSVHSM